MRNKKLAVSMVSLLACLAGSAVFGATTSNATSSTTSASLQEFKLQPAVDLWGYSGNNTLGEGQARLPIYGDSSKVLYGLAEGNTAVNNDSWLGGGGLGYRQVVNNERIFGGYALVDYSNTANNTGFWIVNPGLEMLGQVWDMNINGYIPFVSKKTTGPDVWADDLIGANGINATDYIHFWNHNENAHKFRVFEEMGNGFGAEIGRIIPSFAKAKLYVGGYHFDTDDMGSINGATARLTYGLNKYTALELKNTYDNVNHNKALFGVKLSFGGYSNEQKQEFGISSRLMDPVDNDFARLSAGVGAVVKTKYVDQGEYLEHDNLWFFEPAQITKNGKGQVLDLGDGSYEHPFVDFNLETYNKINPNIGSIDKNPLMYFAPGNYSFIDTKKENFFTLNNGWGIYGRTSNYKAPAMYDNRPVFDDIIGVTPGSQKTTFNSISINPIKKNDNTNELVADRAVLYLTNASNVVLQNLDIQGGNTGLNGILVANSTLNFEALNQSMDGVTTINTETIGEGNGIHLHGGIINFNGGNNNVSGNKDNTEGNSGNGIYVDDGNSDNSTDNIINFNGGNNYITGGSSNAQYSNKVEDSNNGIAAHVINGSSAINFNGGTNIIAGGSSTGGYSNNSIDIYTNSSGEGSNIVNFNKGTNIIKGGSTNTTDRSGYNSDNGIMAYFSTINFIGGNNIITGGNSNSTQNSQGNGINIFGTKYDKVDAISTINFKGGTNTISGGKSIKSSEDASNGIVSNYTNINFNGGTNIISGGTTFNGKYGASNGISFENGTITFNEGTNIISGGYSNTTNGEFNSNGIKIDYSTIIFNGGNNAITGGTNTDTSPTGSRNGNGIDAAAITTITFANFGKPSVNIQVAQNGTNGISADASSVLNIDFSNIGDYANFSHTSTGGNAINWNGHSTLPW